MPAPPSSISTHYTQVNITNLPATAWNKLNASQLEKILLAVLELTKTQDDRRFQLTVTQLESANRSAMHTRYLGAFIAVVGLGAVVYLASIGQAAAATGIGASIATLVAVIIGKKAL